jgi:hypothetical protein
MEHQGSPGDHGQIGLLAERDGHPAFANGCEELRGDFQVDLLRLAARPFHDLDGHCRPLRRFEGQPGDCRSMTGDLSIAPGPLATANPAVLQR